MSKAPFDPVAFDLPDGRRVLLRVFGDEFSARLETLDGYTAVYDDALADYAYATVDKGFYASTGVPVSKPAPAGLRKHLLEAPLVRQHRFATRFEEMRPRATSGLETFGPNAGLLLGRRRSTGKVRGLTILVEFQDVRAGVSVDEVAALMNTPGYSRHGNLGSVRDYFLTMSSGKLDYTNEVVGPVLLSHDRRHYDQVLLVEEALGSAVEQFGVDLAAFATQLPGEPHKVIDALSFLYAGESVTSTSGNRCLWPHNSEIRLRFGDVQTCYYMLTGLGHSAAGLRIGTICHETGHLLCRFPDLYDYGNRDSDLLDSEGLGEYCLMGSGNHLGHGTVPAPVCGYLRRLAGWVDEDKQIELQPGQSYELRHGAYDTVHWYRTETASECFIVENRSHEGYDRHLPSSGLAVMHCDIKGSNEWQDGTPERHYQCALLQADGLAHLESNQGRGDAGDLYRGRSGVFLSASTNPHSRAWDGADSGLVLRNCSAPGPTMRIDVGPEPAAEGFYAEDFPKAVIPDASEDGIRRRLVLPPGTPARRIQVEVSITHTFRGDVEIRLVAPDGRATTLRKRQGREGDDIREVYHSQSHAALATLTGDSGAGAWTLWVRDLEARDVGVLERWSIRCE